MQHATPLAWSYIVFLAGVAIILMAFAIAFRSRRNPQNQNPRITALDDQLSRGEITQEEYDHRRAEILVEEYEKHKSA